LHISKFARLLQLLAQRRDLIDVSNFG
jgi:hypothetical protein